LEINHFDSTSAAETTKTTKKNVKMRKNLAKKSSKMTMKINYADNLLLLCTSLAKASTTNLVTRSKKKEFHFGKISKAWQLS